jgi:hypothetical protein
MGARNRPKRRCIGKVRPGNQRNALIVIGQAKLEKAQIVVIVHRYLGHDQSLCKQERTLDGVMNALRLSFVAQAGQERGGGKV